MPDYEKARIGVDAVIFTIHDGALKVLLHKREKEPFLGSWELPGGLLLKNETAEATLKRKLQMSTGQKEIFFQHFAVFTNPHRDPRERTISIGHIALINHEKMQPEHDWFDCRRLPPLAFDNKEIIEKARIFLKDNISSLIVKQLLPVLFPLNKLQEAYEIIEGEKYDNRNFRKKMLSSGLIEETTHQEKDVSHRPAKLYKFKKTVNTA